MPASRVCLLNRTILMHSSGSEKFIQVKEESNTKAMLMTTSREPLQ